MVGQGRWRLNTQTIRVSGDGCDMMDMKLGFTTKSSVHITPAATEDGKIVSVPYPAGSGQHMPAPATATCCLTIKDIKALSGVLCS